MAVPVNSAGQVYSLYVLQVFRRFKSYWRVTAASEKRPTAFAQRRRSIIIGVCEIRVLRLWRILRPLQNSAFARFKISDITALLSCGRPFNRPPSHGSTITQRLSRVLL